MFSELGATQLDFFTSLRFPVRAQNRVPLTRYSRSSRLSGSASPWISGRKRTRKAAAKANAEKKKTGTEVWVTEAKYDE